jgi:ankyrin repeat protein
MRAAEHNHAEVVLVLLGGAGADVNDKAKDGWTALMYAAYYGYVDVGGG